MNIFKKLSLLSRTAYVPEGPERRPERTTNDGAPRIAFSSAPGAYERHLMRRAGNPFFPKGRRVVTINEVLEARARDQALHSEHENAIGAVVMMYQNMVESGRAIRIDQLDARRAEVDTLYSLVAATDKLGYGQRIVLIQLRNDIIGRMREIMAQHPNGLEALEHAESLHQRNDIRITTEEFMHQVITIKDPPCIPPDDLFPGLLSGDEDELRYYFETRALSTNHKRDGLRRMLELIMDASDEGRPILEVTGKLVRAVGESLGMDQGSQLREMLASLRDPTGTAGQVR